jgi:hypothetical protein
MDEPWNLIDYIGPSLAVVCFVMTPIAERVTRRRNSTPEPPDPLVVLVAAVYRRLVRRRH